MTVFSRSLGAGLLLLLTLAGCASQNGPATQPAQTPASAALHKPAPLPPNIKPYPFKDPLAATVLSTPPKLRADLPSAGDINLSVQTLDPLVERETPPKLRYARPLQYLLAAQDHPAPLAFVIAGTGSSALSSKCVTLSKALYQVGYSVACLPSPTSVTFMLGAASHPVPGRMKTDSEDLYRMMQAVRDHLPDTMNVTGYSLTGVSLGATEAAFVAYRDQQQQRFNFKHVLLVDPTVSVWTSVGRMDTLLDKSLPGGVNTLPEFLSNVLSSLQQGQGPGQRLNFDEATLYRAYKSGHFNKQQVGALIGLTFRLSLANMAFAADVLTHSDVIVPKDVVIGQYDSMDIYFKRSIRLSFSDYINELLVPYWNRDGRHVSKHQLVAEANLHHIESFLAHNRRIGVFTNADDPILDSKDVAFLRQTFGNRARIQPHGGHMGNLSYKKTIHALQEFFTQ